MKEDNRCLRTDVALLSARDRYHAMKYPGSAQSSGETSLCSMPVENLEFRKSLKENLLEIVRLPCRYLSSPSGVD